MGTASSCFDLTVGLGVGVGVGVGLGLGLGLRAAQAAASSAKDNGCETPAIRCYFFACVESARDWFGFGFCSSCHR